MENWKFDPSPGTESTQMRPPWRVTSSLQIYNPSPSPPPVEQADEPAPYNYSYGPSYGYYGYGPYYPRYGYSYGRYPGVGVGVSPYGDVDVRAGRRVGVGVWGPYGGVRVGRIYVGW